MHYSDVQSAPNLLLRALEKDIAVFERLYDLIPGIFSCSPLLPHFLCLFRPKVHPVLQEKSIPVPILMKPPVPRTLPITDYHLFYWQISRLSVWQASCFYTRLYG